MYREHSREMIVRVPFDPHARRARLLESDQYDEVPIEIGISAPLHRGLLRLRLLLEVMI
jgi:hypothetical protein